MATFDLKKYIEQSKKEYAKPEEKQKEFCAFLKAAIIDEEKANKEYKEMAEKVRELKHYQVFTATGFYEENVLKSISEDEAKHKLHLEQIAKDLGCKNG